MTDKDSTPLPPILGLHPTMTEICSSFSPTRSVPVSNIPTLPSQKDMNWSPLRSRPSQNCDSRPLDSSVIQLPLDEDNHLLSLDQDFTNISPMQVPELHSQATGLLPLDVNIPSSKPRDHTDHTPGSGSLSQVPNELSSSLS